MHEEVQTMSDEKKAKKKGKGKKLLLIAIVTAVVGAGGAAGAYYTGNAQLLHIGNGHAEPDRPQLVLRDGVAASVAQRYFSPTGDVRPDPSKFEATYYPLGENFTANLQGTGFVQAGIGVSTFYDERVIDNLKRHEMAVRSAILLTLSEQDSDALATPQGKQALQSALRNSVNDVLKRKEGFGGIDDVYFTSFVIQ